MVASYLQLNNNSSSTIVDIGLKYSCHRRVIMIKADIAALNKVLNKCKPEKMNENDISELRSTTARLEASASHLVNL